MTLADLKPGLRHARTIMVTAAMGVPASGRLFAAATDMPPVFATASMIALVEWTCVEALAPYIDDGQRTVGTHVDISHSAATPIGMIVTAEVELVAVEGRRLRFKACCRDERDTIGEGFHDRFVVDHRGFMERLRGKSQGG